MRIKKEENEKAKVEEKKEQQALKMEQRKLGSLREQVEEVPARNVNKVFEKFEGDLKYQKEMKIDESLTIPQQKRLIKIVKEEFSKFMPKNFQNNFHHSN